MDETKIIVKLGERSYPIIICKGCPEGLPFKLRELFPNTSSFGIVTNSTIASIYQKVLSNWQTHLRCVVHVMPDGERYKTLQTCAEILDTLLENRLDRRSVICAFGGGVVGDVAGFAASICLRGIDYVQVPTTLLSMVDSSVGGKTAVNHNCGKNLIGTFHQPRFVWIDTSWLSSLSEREYIAGCGELFKYAFIGGKTMFDFILNNFYKIKKREPESLHLGIEKAIRIKAAVVEEDEREAGKRALLNFGHTFAHAIEKFYNYESILHGEAVIIGIVCAVNMGIRLGSIPQKYTESYKSILWQLPSIRLPSKINTVQVYKNMFSDKKVMAGQLRFIVPAAPGNSIVVEKIEEKTIIETLDESLGNFQ